MRADQVVVGGSTATDIDLTQLIKGRLLPFIGGVILGAFLLLMMVFRSLFVPFKAAVMNLLSIGAAYGLIVAMFQWGWGRGAIGLQRDGAHRGLRAGDDVRHPVRPVHGLRGLPAQPHPRGLRPHRRQPRQSVVNGLAATARVITSAALIMISVFLAFVTNPSPTVKMIGLGMAVAVFIDATIVRMMLVPVDHGAGRALNWWFPAWLDRILPHINVDPPQEAVAPPAPPAGDGSEAETGAEGAGTEPADSVPVA